MLAISRADKEIINATQGTLITMSKKGFNYVFQQWAMCWEKCIEFRREYFEHLKMLET